MQNMNYAYAKQHVFKCKNLGLDAEIRTKNYKTQQKAINIRMHVVSRVSIGLNRPKGGYGGIFRGVKESTPTRAEDNSNDSVVEIDLPDDIEEDITLWREKAIIRRFIGAKITRSQTRDWVKDNWSQEVVLKFIPKGFFIGAFRDETIRNKILNQQNCVYDSARLYLQSWQPNFDMVSLSVFKKPIWIRLYNLPMDYWGDSCLESIGRLLGTLLEVDEEIIENDSYLFARIKIVAVRKVPSILYLKTGGSRWSQHVEVENPSPGGERGGFKDHDAKASNGLVKPVRKWI
ncbi:hypothetical protein SUGI_0768150 [Cryptomeria japonica]|nr:hypothetical protein SUGI_0768150 [Cryptomeria japonica]